MTDADLRANGFPITFARQMAELNMPRDYSQLRYWIDRDGKVWHGPVSPEDNVHYATFEGFTTMGEQIWLTRRTDPPENAVELKRDPHAPYDSVNMNPDVAQMLGAFSEPANRTDRQTLIAEARRAVLTPYCSSLSGARRSTKRDAVEAAFPICMDWAIDDEDGGTYLDYDGAAKDRESIERSMYNYVYHQMTSSLTWLLLWFFVRASVRYLVVRLVEWLLIRNDHERMRRASKVAWDFINDAKREAGT